MKPLFLKSLLSGSFSQLKHEHRALSGPVLCAFVRTSTSVQSSGVSVPLGSGAASQLEGNSHLFRLPGVVSVVLFQVKAVITFLKAERLLPLLLPDSKLTFFPGSFSVNLIVQIETQWKSIAN